MPAKDFISKIINVILPVFLTYLLTFNKYSEVDYKVLSLFLFMVLREVGFHSWEALLAWIITGIFVGGMLRDVQKHGTSILIAIFTYLFLELYLLSHYNIMSWDTLLLFQKILSAFVIGVNFLLNGVISIIPTILVLLFRRKNDISFLIQEFEPIKCPICGRMYESNPKYCVFCGAKIREGKDH